MCEGLSGAARRARRSRAGARGRTAAARSSSIAYASTSSTLALSRIIWTTSTASGTNSCGATIARPRASVSASRRRHRRPPSRVAHGPPRPFAAASRAQG
eukprot:4242542-Prymnesium_polylepis.1